jgi:hypothetical protein
LGTPHENPNHEPGSNGPRVEQAPATRRDANAWDTVYAQKAVTVRANRGTVYEAVRTLDPGEPVKVVSRDQSGWVLLYELDGHPIGYAFRSKASFGPHPPAPPPASLMQPQLILAAEHEPSPAPGPVDTTALCRDGAASFSRHSSGTCSGHGGVRCWLHHPGPDPPRGSPFCASRRPSQEPSTWRSASADR